MIRALDGSYASRRGYVADKLFVLTTKLFDAIVEPALHTEGVNVYENTWNIFATLNLHQCLLERLGFEGLVEFHVNLEHILRQREPLALEAFWKAFAIGVVKPASGQGSDVLRIMHHYGRRMTVDEYLDLPDILQIGPSLLAAELISWTELGKRRIAPVHDESSIVTASAPEIEYLRGEDEKQHWMGYEGSPGYFHPLPLDPLRIGKSHEWFGLQIADLLAGAYAEIAKAASGFEHDQLLVASLRKVGFDKADTNILFDPGWKSPFQSNPAGLDPIAHRAAASLQSVS